MANLLAYLSENSDSPLRSLACVTLAEDNLFPEEKPEFAFVQLPVPGEETASGRARIDQAIQFAKKKIPIALISAAPEHLHELTYIRTLALKNRLPVVLLGSFRFIPAVAALKEIAVSGVLGQNLVAQASLAPRLAQANCLNTIRLADAATWIAETPAVVTDDENISHASIQVTGTNGTAAAFFSLDGTTAELSLTTPHHTHRRHIPAADPAESELAVLFAELFDETRLTKKIKTMPMMMCLADSVF